MSLYRAAFCFQSSDRRIVLAGALAAACAACQAGGIADIQLPPGNRPVEVITYATPNVMRVGDTLTAWSFAYDSTGYETMDFATRLWHLSDSTVVRLEDSKQLGGRLVRAVAPGVSVVTTTIAGLSGSDTVWVVPSSATVHLQLSSTTVTIGDTLIATCSASGVGGVSVPIRRMVPLNGVGETIGIGPLDTLGHWRIIAVAPGTIHLSAALGYLRDTITFRVVPRP